MGPRSTSRSTSADDVVVGVIRSPHGVRGEVKVESRTDVADRFKRGARLRCDGVGEIVVASARGPSDVPIVRFEGYSSRGDADRLRGKRLLVARADARRAAKGAHLWADLLGLRAVTPEGEDLGAIREIVRAGETDVLVIHREDRRDDVLVPTIESVVREVDVAGGRVVIVPQESAG